MGWLLAGGVVPTHAGPAGNAEAVRAACIEGRRCICGRVVQVTPAGLVVDSGYASLLEPPLNRSWLTPATAAPVRAGNLVEKATPDALAVGLVLLTDFPRRKVVQVNAYVALHGYPAGQADFVPVPGVTNRLRRFAGGLETAVRLRMAGDL